MTIYAFLFAVGFLNEATLTSYYLRAAKGQRWRCVGLSLLQQLWAISATFFTLVDVVPMSREQFIRWGVTAASYGCATMWIVKPISEVKP